MAGAGAGADDAPVPFRNSRRKPRGFLPSTLKYFADNPHRSNEDDRAYYKSMGLPYLIDAPFFIHKQQIRLPLFDTVAGLIIELSQVPPHNLTRIEAIRDEIYTILAETTSRQTVDPLLVMGTPGPITWWVEEDIERSRAQLATLGDEEAKNMRKLIGQRQRDFLLYDGTEADYMKE